MGILIQILLILALVGLAACLTTVYWLRVVRKLKAADKHGQRMQDGQFLELKAKAMSHKQTKLLKSERDFLKSVLNEVQQQLESVDSDDRLNEMVSSTLQLMRYEEMEDIEKSDTVVVNSFCKKAFVDCQQHLIGHVELRLETELDDNETVITNKDLLQQVLKNLIRCSMQFTHEGEIVLGVSRQQGRLEDCLIIKVNDTGLGIPEDVRDVAFEQMTDTDISIKNVVVRLRLCKVLVKLLGGSIYIDPSHEKGTSIVFTIKMY